MPIVDPSLLILSCNVSREFKDLTNKVVKHTGHVDGSVSSDHFVQTISLHQLHDFVRWDVDFGSLSSRDLLVDSGLGLGGFSCGLSNWHLNQIYMRFLVF